MMKLVDIHCRATPFSNSVLFISTKSVSLVWDKRNQKEGIRGYHSWYACPYFCYFFVIILLQHDNNFITDCSSQGGKVHVHFQRAKKVVSDSTVLVP